MCREIRLISYSHSPFQLFKYGPIFLGMKPNLAFTKIDSSLFLCDIVIPDGCRLISILILMHQKYLLRCLVQVIVYFYRIISFFFRKYLGYALTLLLNEVI